MRIFSDSFSFLRGKEVLALFICIAAQAALTLSYSITLHYELKTSGLDGMVYEQLFHNFLDGNGFRSSINPPYTPQQWLGFHFSPILFLLLPFYNAYPHIETLLAAGSIAVALAAWPIFLTARAIFHNSAQALLVAVLYLIHPFVINGTLWDFHEVDFAPLCIGFMLWAVVERRRFTLLALSAVLLCMKEHYGIAVAGFGLLWFWHWREIRFGLGLTAFGITAFCIILFGIIPHYNPMGHSSMMNAASTQDRFSWLTHWETIKLRAGLISSDGFWYGAKLLLPMLLLPLISLAWLLPMAADMAVNILSQESMMRSPYSYHSIAIIPVLLIAACHTIRYYCNGRIRFSVNDVLLPITVMIACYSFMQTSLPFSDTSNVWEFSAPHYDYAAADRESVDAINGIIPKDAPVAAQINVLPHLKPRLLMTPFPFTEKADYVVLNLRFPFEHALNILGIPYGITGSLYFAQTEALLRDKRWSIIYYDNRWVVAKRESKVKDNGNARKQALDGLNSLRGEYAVVRERYVQSYAMPR